MKSGSLNILEPSGPVQAGNDIALPLLPVTISHTQSDSVRWYVDLNTYFGCVALRTFRVDELHGARRLQGAGYLSVPQTLLTRNPEARTPPPFTDPQIYDAWG